MSQKGEHTWDLVLHYHCCPQCGKILESRDDYQYRLGCYQKELQCERCHLEFTVTKSTHPTFGPLIGEPHPPEMDWGSGDS